jgi:hypothetical protein
MRRGRPGPWVLIRSASLWHPDAPFALRWCQTASNHIEHIYTRIGVSSRATASLFAMQHGLLADTYSSDQP